MTAKRIVLLICSFALILTILDISSEGKKRIGSRYFIGIVQLADCPERYSVSFSNITHVGYTGGALNGFVVIHEDLQPAKLVAYFHVSKCKTLDDAGCEPLVSGVIDGCKLLVEKGQFYSPFFGAIDPQIKCPVKKGTYEIKNGSLSYEAMEHFLKFIPSSYYQAIWKLKLVMTPPGKPEKIKSCFYLVFKYYQKRAR